MPVVVEDLEPFSLADDGLTYWKQVIYENPEFSKGDEMKFGVSDGLIEHWVETHKKFRERGIDVPLPKDHTTDVEANRGSVIELAKRPDAKGRNSLYARVRFRDHDAAKLHKTAKVSLYSPPDWTDEHSNYYTRPIRHIALTDYPVVNDLEGFIAASHIEEGELEMSVLSDLASAIGAKIEGENPSDESVVAAIKKVVADLKEKAKAAKPAPAEEKPDEEKKIAASTVSPILRDEIVASRVQRIDGLLKRGFNAAVTKQLKEQFCDPSKVSLVLSRTDETDDGFRQTMESLELNKETKIGEHTGPQLELKLSAEDNPLIANAEKRAKQTA